jgi:hypothetical protein
MIYMTKFASYFLTEPDSVSDVQAMKSPAEI